ncbi:ATP-binding SpoIIE family protein phosphatase [Cellvibrio japonicus]|nr:fused response regulator/phosphatase [Cellvibrio japonicus]QEI12239.1 fused response regulator/phosphatase [Cellvibrio japonicus]QEI15813.1 fused response regulator/phosphatase [Cellvibrio japonicus]QEI19391.1 fused response regulator/phosphatase [Cellvibrio japonicus]
MNNRRLKILVADDTDTDRLILESILRKEGHQVLLARNGLEAISAYEAEHPDIVLLDALMPEMDGFGAARTIKQLAGDELVPIIFLTSLSDTESLVRCLDAGGDDFLSKPYNRVILQAKIKAFNRMRELHSTMLTQRDQIVQYNNRLLQEQQVAKHVFDNVAHSGCLNAKNVRFFLSSLAVFNGDVLVAAMRPNGNMMVLLGDFTGHGLPAAIGAMPLASTFYGMVPKGFGMSDILREINGKLKNILPVGIFCCAIMLDINFRKRRVKIWNGGLPDAFIYRQKTATVVPVRSTHLPLGVLSNRAFKDNCEYFELAINDRIFLWSDGIHEARNLNGDMFGEERLKQVFVQNREPSRLFDEIIEQVQQFVGTNDKDDDLSLLEIRMDEPAQVDQAFVDANQRFANAEVEWSMRFEVNPRSFRVFDPLPMLLNVLMEVPSLRSFSSTIYTILAELYANALEHGVLQLNSTLKKTPSGFSDYYRLREERLQQLDTGYVRFHINHRTHDEGGILRVRVEDSGKGFDYQNRNRNSLHSLSYSGRGLALLESLCSSVNFIGAGNTIEVEFCWVSDD